MGIVRSEGSFYQGAEFENDADVFLETCGLKLHGEHVFGGCSFDQLATTSTGREILFEHKGSFRGNRPGMMRTDTVKKALLSGFINKELKKKRPYHIVTSHIANYPYGAYGDLPRSLKMIEAAYEAKAVNAIWVIGDVSHQSSLYEFTKWHFKYFLRTGKYKGGFWNYVELVGGVEHEGNDDWADIKRRWFLDEHGPMK